MNKAELQMGKFKRKKARIIEKIKGEIINGEIYILLSEVNKEIQKATDKSKKEELEYWNKVRSRKGHVDDNSNGIKERILWLKEKK